MVTVAEAPDATVPSAQVNVGLAAVHVPSDGVIVPRVNPAGNVSETLTAVAFEAPLFVTVTVYVCTTAEPAVTEVTPSVFVIDRSACGVNVSVSVAALFAVVASVVPAGAVTVAVFDREPVA